MPYRNFNESSDSKFLRRFTLNLKPCLDAMGTGSFPGVKRGRGVTLTPHYLLVPCSRKGRAKPLLSLWAVRPVQSLSACTEPQCLYKGALHSQRNYRANYE